jgi:DNA-binding protein YbaB
VGREIDEAFIEEAVERYQRVDALLTDFEKAMRGVEVTVSSPDGLVEVVVRADGTIRDVTITGTLTGRSSAQLSRSIRDAVTAAADAASWARAKLHAETFGGYRSLGEV